MLIILFIRNEYLPHVLQNTIAESRMLQGEDGEVPPRAHRAKRVQCDEFWVYFLSAQLNSSGSLWSTHTHGSAALAVSLIIRKKAL